MPFYGGTDKLHGLRRAASRRSWLAHRNDGRTLRRMSSDPKPGATDATHAGGAVYRERGDRVEYLLVRATGPLREWVLPKGHVEAGETTREAAVREVEEEADVQAQIVAELDTVEYTLRGERVKVQFYLMKALPADEPRLTHSTTTKENRECAWLPLDEAGDRLAHEAYRQLLAVADRTRPGSDT